MCALTAVDKSTEVETVDEGHHLDIILCGDDQRLKKIVSGDGACMGSDRDCAKGLYYFP